MAKKKKKHRNVKPDADAEFQKNPPFGTHRYQIVLADISRLRLEPVQARSSHDSTNAPPASASSAQWIFSVCSESLPLKLLVGPIVVGALTLVAWYATIFHYQLRHAICYSCRHSWDCRSGGRKRDAVGGIEQCLTPRRWSCVGQLE